MYRRRVIQTLGAVSAVGLAGCSGSPTRFEAEPAATTEAAANATGYEKQGTRSQAISREFGGTTVEVVNKVTTYEKRFETVIGSVRAGVFVALSTPAVEVAGQTFNPVAGFSTDRLVETFATNYGGIEDPTRVGESSVEVFGETRTLVRYEATATFQGQEIDVTIHLTEAIRDGDDFVIPMVVYPTRHAAREREHARTLVGGLRHPV